MSSSTKKLVNSLIVICAPVHHKELQKLCVDEAIKKHLAADRSRVVADDSVYRRVYDYDD